MRIIVDHDICSGHGRCNAAAPDLYTLDESGYSAITEVSVAPGDEAAARAGVDACPERAIQLVD
jgi:ferredoxin